MKLEKIVFQTGDVYLTFGGEIITREDSFLGLISLELRSGKKVVNQYCRYDFEKGIIIDTFDPIDRNSDIPPIDYEEQRRIKNVVEQTYTAFLNYNSIK